MVQWLRLWTSAGSVGLIPDQGTKIPHAVQCSQKKKKKKAKTKVNKNTCAHFLLKWQEAAGHVLSLEPEDPVSLSALLHTGQVLTLVVSLCKDGVCLWLAVCLCVGKGDSAILNCLWDLEDRMLHDCYLVKAATKLNNNIHSKKYTHLPALPIMCVLFPLDENSEVNMASVSFF